MYQTTAQKAATIRQTIKEELGFNSRQVSVRCSAGGGSIRVEINVAVGDKFRQIERIAEAQESVRYCEASGEILSGGNTFVTVGFNCELVKATAPQFYDWLDSLTIEHEDRMHPSDLYSNDGGVVSRIMVSRTAAGFSHRMWGGCRYDRDEFARIMARYFLRGVRPEEEQAEIAPAVEVVASPAIFEAPGEPFELTALAIRAALAVGWSGMSSGVAERFH